MPRIFSLERVTEMSNFGPESHVAQQSRRDKLRIQQSSAPDQNLEGFPNNLEQLSVHQGLNPDLIQVRNVRNAKLLYNSTALSSEMLNCSTSSNVILAHKDGMMHQEPGAAQPPDGQISAGDAFFGSSPYPFSSSFNPSSKAATDPRNCGNWKSLGSQQSCDWSMNYASGSAGNRGNNQNHMFVGEVLSGSMKGNAINSATMPYLKPSYNGIQDVQSSLTNPSSEISSQDSEKHYGAMNFNSPPSYQNTLQEVVHQNIRETGRGSWAVGGNELVFLPAYGDQSNALHLSNPPAWINRTVEDSHQWSGELGFLANKSDAELRSIASDSNNTQGLSLSLSSKPPQEIHGAQFGGNEASRSRTGVFSVSQDSKSMKSNQLCSNLKPLLGSKGYGSSLQDIVGTSAYAAHRNSGPLGPFTGYTTILKSSKFLKPAQLLLDEFCSVTGSKFVKTCEASERISGEVSGSADAVNAAKAEIFAAKGDNSGASSSTFHSSNEFSGEGGVASSSCESHRPEYQQKKAKLLYMQEEVCRRYKQYHQQMHMVVSLFESVAGLSAAAPYISLALKTVSRHFRCLKNAISDQLRHISKSLGEDKSSPTTGMSSSKGDITMSRLKLINQSFQKHKSSGADMGFLEPQQHIWRPQRGLPERAVAVLRAWLFEHFLHPYPTDTDKHMLATQTGLTRNQVSNWFINARVRVWKPMVEEIHMLETKGSTETELNSGKNDGKFATTENTSRKKGEQPSNNLSMNAITDKQMECCNMGSSGGTGDGLSAEPQWNQEKRSRVESQIPTTMDDGSLMGFMPYQRNGLEMGGLGAVSLTLGLRHGAENAQQQQQEQEQLLRQHFGGQMIHDFVG